MGIIHRMGILASSSAIALCGAAAQANVIIYDGLEGGSGDVQNVLYGDFSGQQGTTVQGSLNQTGQLVDFTSTDVLVTPSGGQARIEALDGSFNNLVIELADQTLGFAKIQFNINAASDGSAKLSFWDQFGTLFSGTYALSGSGQNFFTAIAYDDQVMVRARIDTSVAMTALDDVKQIRLGPAGRATTTVAEPGTLGLVLIGLGGLAVALRRREAVLRT